MSEELREIERMLFKLEESRKNSIAFAPKYRRLKVYGELKADIGAILRKLCERKKKNIVEVHVDMNCIYMLVEILPNLSVCQFVEFLKG